MLLSKRENGDAPQKIYDDLNGAVSLRTIKNWCKMLRETGAIELRTPPGRPRTVRTKEFVQKVKRRVKRKKGVTTRKLAAELDASETTTRRCLKEDLRFFPYKKIVQPMLPLGHKKKRVKFGNWVRKRYRKSDTMRILFSDEKMFDIDGLYNAQNDRVWAPNRAAANESGGIKPKQKFPQKVMVWLGACTEGVTPLVILDKGTVDHARYISDVLPVALKYGNKVFGDNWVFQQDGARAHTHQKSQQWCKDKFPDFIPAGRWPPNSPDLNPLDYSVWEEFVHAMHWNRVKSKTTLIDELKRAVKRIRPQEVRDSCASWYSRVRKVSENGGIYFEK